MDKTFKTVVYVLLAVVVINFVMNFTERSHIKEVLRNIEQSQRHIDTAMNEIQSSRVKIDSIQADLANFKLYIDDIQKSVALMDLKKRIEEIKDRKLIDSLKKERDSLELAVNNVDPLPPLVIKRQP